MATKTETFKIPSQEVCEELNSLRVKLIATEHAYQAMIHLAQKMTLKDSGIPDGSQLSFNENTMEFTFIRQVPDDLEDK